MNPLIFEPISAPISFFVSSSAVNIQHPAYKDIPGLISLLTTNDLDLRRLTNVSKEHYLSMGEKWIKNKWDRALNEFQAQYSESTEALGQLSKQAEEILKYKPILSKGSGINDPFNMGIVEKVPIQTLAKEQLKNTIVAIFNNEIIGAGRLLEVEGSVELVSLLTKKEWRGKGIASKIIDELLERSVVRPIFSFQVPNLIPFYLKRYQRHANTVIPSFHELPEALQRDLFYMNIFWGSYAIIRLD